MPSKRGKAVNRFPERKAFEISLATSARIFMMILMCLQVEEDYKEQNEYCCAVRYFVMVYTRKSSQNFFHGWFCLRVEGTK